MSYRCQRGNNSDGNNTVRRHRADSRNVPLPHLGIYHHISPLMCRTSAFVNVENWTRIELLRRNVVTAGVASSCAELLTQVSK